jgi:hypothetical protein
MSKLIGKNPNQVPSNADLGTLAYQNSDRVSIDKLAIGPDTHGYSKETYCPLAIHNPIDYTFSATTKAEMTDYAVLTLQPTLGNSTHMSFAQVNDGNGMGIQVTNKAGSANWDIALNPFGGNVGVGNDDPLQLFSIAGRFNSDSNKDYYGAWGEGNTASGGSNFFAVGNWYSSSAYFSKKSGEGVAKIYTYNSGHNIAIQSGSGSDGETAGGGRVGIGTQSPDLKLHVDGSNGYPATSGTTAAGHIAIRAKSESSSHGVNIGVANASPWGSWIQAQDANNLATNYPLLLNPNGGNIGVGVTQPGANLHVEGNTSEVTTKTSIEASGFEFKHIERKVINDSNAGSFNIDLVFPSSTEVSLGGTLSIHAMRYSSSTLGYASNDFAKVNFRAGQNKMNGISADIGEQEILGLYIDSIAIGSTTNTARLTVNYPGATNDRVYTIRLDILSGTSSTFTVTI